MTQQCELHYIVSFSSCSRKATNTVVDAKYEPFEVFKLCQYHTNALAGNNYLVFNLISEEEALAFAQVHNS